MDDEQIPKFVL